MPKQQQEMFDDDIETTEQLSPKDFADAAAQIYQEFKRRKEHKDRQEIEKRWVEVDRQVSMKPRDSGRPDWMPDFELPYQANALEVLCADADQLLFPGTGEFFNVHAQMTGEYLDVFKEDVKFLNGDLPEEDEFDVTQDNLNEINQALLIHAHAQYNFQDKIKVSNAEAFKYGTRALRVRAMRRVTFRNEFNGVLREESIMPVVVPVSIKDFYPDDLAHKALSHGLHLRPMEMLHTAHRISDLKLAAAKGSSDVDDNENGGWIKKAVADINLADAAPDDPFIQVIEAEGDLVFPKSQGKDVIMRNALVTVGFGKALGNPTILRVRSNPYSFNSVFWSSYFDDAIGLYGTSPLMKGESMQKMAQQAAEGAISASAFASDPVLLVNRSDPYLRAKGDYDLFPGAQISALGTPQVLPIGSINEAAQVFSQMTQQHNDTTGVNPPRLGAQTKSHQTAYAIETEEVRGQSRTVAFVRSEERGILRNILQAEAEILRKDMKAQNVFVPSQSAYIVASGKSVAPDLTFSVLGSSAPFEQQRRNAQMQQTVQGLVQVEQIATAAGARPLNWDYIREHFLREAFPAADVPRFFIARPTQPPAETVGAPGVPVADVPGQPPGTPGATSGTPSPPETPA